MIEYRIEEDRGWDFNERLWDGKCIGPSSSKDGWTTDELIFTAACCYAHALNRLTGRTTDDEVDDDEHLEHREAAWSGCRRELDALFPVLVLDAWCDLTDSAKSFGDDIRTIRVQDADPEPLVTAYDEHGGERPLF